MLLLFLVPLSYAVVNLIDKYVVMGRVHSPKSYVVLVGWVHMLIGVLLLLFTPWTKPSPFELTVLFSLGGLYAMMLIVYFVLFAQEDAVNIVGIDSAYPLVVVFLSWMLLRERLPSIGYVGLFLALLGVGVLFWRMASRSIRAHPGMLVGMILLTGTYEFVIKVSTLSISELTGVAMNSVVAGALVQFLLLKPGMLSEVRRELPNLGWAACVEVLTVGAITTLFLAMARYPAGIVVGIATLQPLIVLGGEQLFGHHLRTRDLVLWPKLTGTILVVSGVVLLLSVI